MRSPRGRPLGPAERKATSPGGAPTPHAPPVGRGLPPVGVPQALGGCLPVLLVLGLMLVGLFAGDEGSSSSGLPKAPGRYAVKEKSVTFDGERYSFLWADASGALQRATTADVQLVLDEQNVLEITADGQAVLHLRQDEPVTVEGRDRQGDFGNFWYPFIVGGMGGSPPVIVSQPRDPVYRYPPVGSFDRGETMTGSVTRDRPGLPPVGGAVSGQAGGAGGGSAAINRSQTAPSSGGQSGGTGAGRAATNKSGSYRSDYVDRVDAGQVKPINPGTGPRVGAGSGSLSGSKPSISTGRSSAPASSGRAPSISTSRSGGSTPRISTSRR